MHLLMNLAAIAVPLFLLRMRQPLLSVCRNFGIEFDGEKISVKKRRLNNQWLEKCQLDPQITGKQGAGSEEFERMLRIDLQKLKTASEYTGNKLKNCCTCARPKILKTKKVSGYR